MVCQPWNFAEPVREQLHFPKQIKFHDITLRDGEQQTGVIFTKDDKIRIAEGLAEAGVHRIEAGMPVVSPSDAAAIKEIVKRNLGPQIFAFSRCMVDDVKRAVDCGVKGIVMEVPSSTHIIEYAYKWPLEKAIDLSIESTAYAHSQGLEVVFFPIDFSRAEINWVLDLITRVANEGHMDALALVDTFGVLAPHAMQYLVREAKKRINKRLEAHFHMDFGMGIANTIMAVAEGVEVIHSTVLGLGERAGNVPMEETAMALLHAVWHRHRLEVRQVLQAGAAGGEAFRPPCRATGRWSASSCSRSSPASSPAGGRTAARSTPPSSSRSAGTWSASRRPRSCSAKGSGIDSIKAKLKKLGIQASEEEAMKVVMAVKQHSLSTKSLLTDEEFRKVVASVLPQPVGSAKA